MVVFCCSVCCDSLKKNQVQKHYSRCRMGMVSCMDCSQEFFGDDYQQHIKCISEEEKYSGKDYKPRPGQNKGEAKQEAWLEQVQKAIDQVSNQAPKLRSLLERMKDYPNIPRKQAKFLNFVRNSLGVYDPKLATSVWDILMPVQPKEAEPPVNGNKENSNCDDDDDKNKNGESAENMEVDEEEEEGEVETKKAKKINKREKKEERRKEKNKQEKKEKKKQMANGGDDAGEVENERPTKKKGKKRKRNADLSEGEEMEITVAAEEAKKKKKKTHKVKQKDDDDDDGMLPLEPNPNHASLGETEEVEDEEEEEGEGEDSPPQKKRQPKKKFDWEEVIFALLENAKEKSMSEKKLRKKVLAEYMDQGGHVDSMSLLLAKFERKIKKNPQLLRLKDTVSLRERQKY